MKTPFDQSRASGNQYDKERARSAKNSQNRPNQSENMIRPSKEKDSDLRLPTDDQPPDNQEIPGTQWEETIVEYEAELVKCAAEGVLANLVRKISRKLEKRARLNRKEPTTSLPLEIKSNDNTLPQCKEDVGAPAVDSPNKTVHWRQIYGQKKECKIVKRAVNPIDKPNKQVLPTEIPNSRKMETLNEPKTSFSTKDRDEDSSKDHLKESQ